MSRRSDQVRRVTPLRRRGVLMLLRLRASQATDVRRVQILLTLADRVERGYMCLDAAFEAYRWGAS